MVLINKAINELTVKLVYYGPGLCGKTTNLEKIYGNPKLENKGKMISMSTETDRTLFFDFMPMELGTIGGQKVRCQLYTVPGQVFYDATRKLVLRGSDGVVFVADSQNSMRGSNVESLENLKTNLRLNRIDPDKIALVLQYNKRDLPGVDSVEDMNDYLNPGSAPVVEAVAKDGVGVTATLRAAITRILENLRSKTDISLSEEPELSSPDMTSKSGVTSSSAGTPKVSTTSAGGERKSVSTPAPAKSAATAAPAPRKAGASPMAAPSFSNPFAKSDDSSMESRGGSLSEPERSPFDDIDSSIDSAIETATVPTPEVASKGGSSTKFKVARVEPSADSDDDERFRSSLTRAREIVRSLEAALDLARQNERELAEKLGE